MASRIPAARKARHGYRTLRGISPRNVMLMLCSHLSKSNLDWTGCDAQPKCTVDAHPTPIEPERCNGVLRFLGVRGLTSTSHFAKIQTGP